MTFAHEIEVCGRWVGLAITTPIAQSFDSNGGGRYKCASRMPAGLSKAQKRAFAYALADSLSTYCQHSHDCCGHIYQSASVQAVGRKVSIVLTRTRNI